MDPSTSSGGGNLGSRFEELFEFTLALDTASVETVYRIRHDVYCRELGWEPRVNFEEMVAMMVKADLERLGSGRSGAGHVGSA